MMAPTCGSCRTLAGKEGFIEQISRAKLVSQIVLYCLQGSIVDEAAQLKGDTSWMRPLRVLTNIDTKMTIG